MLVKRRFVGGGWPTEYQRKAWTKEPTVRAWTVRRGQQRTMNGHRRGRAGQKFGRGPSSAHPKCGRFVSLPTGPGSAPRRAPTLGRNAHFYETLPLFLNRSHDRSHGVLRGIRRRCVHPLAGSHCAGSRHRCQLRGAVAAGGGEEGPDVFAQGGGREDLAGANVAIGLLAGRLAEVERSGDGDGRGRGGTVYFVERDERGDGRRETDSPTEQRSNRNRHGCDEGPTAHDWDQPDRVARGGRTRSGARGAARVYPAEWARRGGGRDAAAR